MEGTVIYNEQEQSGNYIWFGVPAYMTANFKATFGDEAVLVASAALALILEKPLNSGSSMMLTIGRRSCLLIIRGCRHD